MKLFTWRRNSAKDIKCFIKTSPPNWTRTSPIFLYWWSLRFWIRRGIWWSVGFRMIRRVLIFRSRRTRNANSAKNVNLSDFNISVYVLKINYHHCPEVYASPVWGKIEVFIQNQSGHFFTPFNHALISHSFLCWIVISSPTTQETKNSSGKVLVFSREIEMSNSMFHLCILPSIDSSNFSTIRLHLHLSSFYKMNLLSTLTIIMAFLCQIILKSM